MPSRLKSHIILVLDRLQCVARVNWLVAYNVCCLFQDKDSSMFNSRTELSRRLGIDDYNPRGWPINTGVVAPHADIVDMSCIKLSKKGQRPGAAGSSSGSGIDINSVGSGGSSSSSSDSSSTSKTKQSKKTNQVLESWEAPEVDMQSGRGSEGRSEPGVVSLDGSEKQRRVAREYVQGIMGEHGSEEERRSRREELADRLAREPDQVRGHKPSLPHRLTARYSLHGRTFDSEDDEDRESGDSCQCECHSGDYDEDDDDMQAGVIPGNQQGVLDIVTSYLSSFYGSVPVIEQPSGEDTYSGEQHEDRQTYQQPLEISDDDLGYTSEQRDTVQESRYVMKVLQTFRSLLCILYISQFIVFNAPLSVMKYPTRESPRRDAASPIKYNGLRVTQPNSLAEQQPVGR